MVVADIVVDGGRAGCVRRMVANYDGSRDAVGTAKGSRRYSMLN
jgi:hypothetical protein